LTWAFPIYRIEPDARSSANTRNDSEGRFYKYWCVGVASMENRSQLGRCLFKAAAPDGFTPAQRRLDWSEKVAAELGKLIGIPTAQTDFAVGYAIEQQRYIDGTLSVDYTPPGAQIVSGRRFLSIVDPLYDVDRLDGLDSYSVENILHHLQENLVRLPLGYHPPQGVDTGADLMVGYLLFDAWLSATDRHDENWELSIDNNGYTLCPTFDHGDSLGVKLSAQDREVSNFEHPALIESCWWENITIDGRVESAEISSIRAFTTAAKLYPDAARIWQEQLTQVTSTRIREIFERVPDDRITPTAAKFALDLLDFNRHKLIAISSRPDLQERLNADLTIKEPNSSSEQLKPPQESL
jgi:hypothetical protein